MIDRITTLPADVAYLERISSRIRAGEQPPARLEIERALEGGFGSLIGLEAQLSRVRHQTAPATATGRSPVAELEHQIGALRDALTELRMLSSRPGQSRVGFGFVLPREPNYARARQQ